MNALPNPGTSTTALPSHETSCVVNVLDIAENSFRLLITGPEPLSADGTEIGHGLPRRPIHLGELRTILLHPSTGPATRDAAWHYLIARSRSEGAAWTVGCAGVAMPALVRMTSQLAAGDWHSETDDLASEVVSAFMEALATIDTERPRIARRLTWRIRKAVRAARCSQAGPVPIPPHTASAVAPPPPYGHPDLLLAEAVADGLITEFDAQIIGATRLETIPLTQIAEAYEIPYSSLLKRRKKAESKIAKAIHQGELRAKFPGAEVDTAL